MPIARLAALITTCVLVLAGCDGAGNDNNPTGTPRSAPENGLDPSRQGPAPELKGALVGGVVTAVSPYELDTMDPTQAYSYESVSILSGLVTRSLTQYAYDAQRGLMVLVPDLATDLGTPNDDYTQWTYTIRSGVKFEDGAPVTADDVAYGIKRSFDRTTFKGGPTYSNDYFLHGDTYQGPLPPRQQRRRDRRRRQQAHDQDGQALPRHAVLRRIPGDGCHPGECQRSRQLPAAPAGDRTLQGRPLCVCPGSPSPSCATSNGTLPRTPVVTRTPTGSSSPSTPPSTVSERRSWPIKVAARRRS